MFLKRKLNNFMALENFAPACSSLFSQQQQPEEEEQQCLLECWDLYYPSSSISFEALIEGVGVDDDVDRCLRNNSSILSNVMEGSSPVVSSSSEASTGGYLLQDAVAEWSKRCSKRRRVHLSSSSSTTTTTTTSLSSEFDDAGQIQDLLQGFWDSNCSSDLLPGFSSENNVTKIQEEAIVPKTSVEELQEKLPNPCSEIQPYKLKERESNQQSKNKKLKSLVYYPFNFIKPGGSEEVTLEDINARLLMRPTRPVKHPVGKFACLPYFTQDGRGLSGKAVIGFRKIHTQGRGTITIIRTRGDD